MTAKKKTGTVIMYGAEYLSMAKARELTGYSASQIYKLVKEGKVNRVERGKSHVYSKLDMENYLYGGINNRRAEAEISEAEDTEI